MTHINLLTGENQELPQVNWKLFQGFMENMKIVDSKGKELMNPYQVCQNLFEMTFYHYALKYMEEKHLRIKYEGKVIEKVGDIRKLDDEIKELKDTLRTYLPETGEEEA